MRKYADYQYKIKNVTGRIEKHVNGWIWRIFLNRRQIVSSIDEGEMYTLKRHAKNALYQRAKSLLIMNEKLDRD